MGFNIQSRSSFLSFVQISCRTYLDRAHFQKPYIRGMLHVKIQIQHVILAFFLSISRDLLCDENSVYRFLISLCCDTL